jgi:hypothetical protein
VEEGRPKLYFLGTFEIYRGMSRQGQANSAILPGNRESAEAIQKQDGNFWDDSKILEPLNFSRPADSITLWERSFHPRIQQGYVFLHNFRHAHHFSQSPIRNRQLNRIMIETR